MEGNIRTTPESWADLCDRGLCETLSIGVSTSMSFFNSNMTRTTGSFVKTAFLVSFVTEVLPVTCLCSDGPEMVIEQQSGSPPRMQFQEEGDVGAI